jgi:hypothetical protein
MMTYFGKIQNGMVVLEGGVRLPEGTAVKVEPVVDAASAGVDPLYQLTQLAVPTGVPDLAKNIDHYLYGHPKVSDAAP